MVNADGIPIRTTLDNDTSVQARRAPRRPGAVRAHRRGSAPRTDAPRPAPRRAAPRRAQYAALVTQFTAKARATLKQLPLPGVSSDAGANELMQLRIRSAKHEIIVAPDHDYTLIVVHGGSPKPT